MAEPHGGFPKTSEEGFSTEGSTSSSSWSQESSSETDDSESKDSRRSRGQLSDKSHLREEREESDATSSASSECTSGSTSTHRALETCRSITPQLQDPKAEEPETFSVFGWLTSVLTSWIPDFLNSGHALAEGHRSEASGGQFHDFDVRNVLSSSAKSWSRSLEVEAKPCPHSCAASRCTFRRTLEKWRQQLMLMTEDADTSAAVRSDRNCVFCDNECQCDGQRSCQTMQVARKIWRIVIQLKESDLGSSKCPRANSSTDSVLGYQDDEGGLCGLGHQHTCPRDYLGCSQNQDIPINNSNEATCIHVLLNDLDRLLGKCKQFNKPSSTTIVLLGDSDNAHLQGVEDEQIHQQRVALKCSLGSNSINKQSEEGGDKSFFASHSREPLSTWPVNGKQLTSQERKYTTGPKLDLNPASEVHNIKYKSRLQTDGKSFAEKSLMEEFEELGDFSFSGIKTVNDEIGGKFTNPINTPETSSSTDSDSTAETETNPISAQLQFSSDNTQLSSDCPGQNRTEQNTIHQPTVESSLALIETTRQCNAPAFGAEDRVLQTITRESVENIQQDNASEHEKPIVKETQALIEFAPRCIEHVEEGLYAGDFPKRGDYFRKMFENNYSPESFPKAMSVNSSHLPQTNESSFVPLARKYSDNTSLHKLGSFQQVCELQHGSRSVSPSSQSSLSSPTYSEAGAHQQRAGDSREGDTESCPESAGELQSEKSVIVAIESIIADLNLIKQNEPFARFSSLPSAEPLMRAAKRVKSVTFAQPLFVQKSLSLTSANSDRSLKSASFLCLDGSSCSSFAVNQADSAADFRMKKAFDQLDKVVDEVLQIVHAAANEQ